MENLEKWKQQSQKKQLFIPSGNMVLGKNSKLHGKGCHLRRQCPHALGAFRYRKIAEEIADFTSFSLVGVKNYG